MRVLPLCVRVRVWVRVGAVLFLFHEASLKCAPARSEKKRGGANSKSTQFCTFLVWNRPSVQDAAQGLANLLGMAVAQAPRQNVSGLLARCESSYRTYLGDSRDGTAREAARFAAPRLPPRKFRRPPAARSWSIPGPRRQSRLPPHYERYRGFEPGRMLARSRGERTIRNWDRLNQPDGSQSPETSGTLDDDKHRDHQDGLRRRRGAPAQTLGTPNRPAQTPKR